MRDGIRICLLGEHLGTSDEGMKNLTIELGKKLGVSEHVLLLEPKAATTFDFWYQLRHFSPDIVQYLHGPTIRSMFLLKVVKLFFGKRTKVIATASKPYFGKFAQKLLPFLKSDLVFTQSEVWERFFEKYCYETLFMPNGIDTNGFLPPEIGEKERIRKELGIPADQFVTLHVGHIRKNRNLGLFKALQKIEGIQTVIVGGTTNPSEEDLKKELTEKGCIVFHRYFEDISILYKMADLYVFPTIYDHNRLPVSYNEIGAIDIPLSVLEAMACNLPVVTTSFGALPRLFSPGDGYYVANGDQEIIDLAQEIYSSKGFNFVGTRSQVMEVSWDNVVKKMMQEYNEIIRN